MALRTTIRIGPLLAALLFVADSIAYAGDQSADAVASADKRREWAVTVYNAVLSPDAFWEVLTFKADLDWDYRFVAAALSKEVFQFNKHSVLEVEGQVAKHYKGGDYWEFNLLADARWLTFPWNKYVLTSAAFGAGFSYATQEPEFEIKNTDDETNKFLIYLMVELALSVPKYPEWALVTRIHHRSGAWGTIGDATGASNAVGLGIKYRF